MGAGSRVTVDVYVEGADDVRAYEVRVQPVGGRRSGLAFESADVRSDRKDYIFKDPGGYHAVDPIGGRIVGILLDGSVSSSRHAYLGSFTFHAARHTRGVFSFAVQIGRDTWLINSAGDSLPLAPAEPVAVTVR